MATENDHDNELELLRSSLAGMPKQTPYTVPADYFEHFPSAMLKKVQEAKVVRMPFSKRNWKLAAAAVIAGALLTGGWLFYRQPSTATVTQQPVLVQKQMQQVSEPEMVAYLERNNISVMDESTGFSPIRATDLSLVFIDVSDQELQYYLDKEDLFVEKFN